MVGSNREVIFDLGGLRKKYTIRCQISCSKNMLVQFHNKCLCSFDLNKSLTKLKS